MKAEDLKTPPTEEEVSQLLNDENMLEAGRDILRRLLFQRDSLIYNGLELAQYASYAEIVGGIGVNRPAIRKWCDIIFEANRATI